MQGYDVQLSGLQLQSGAQMRGQSGDQGLLTQVVSILKVPLSNVHKSAKWAKRGLEKKSKMKLTFEFY